MRWEDFRRSENVEDRREDDSSGYDGGGPRAGLPIGGGGLGIGGVVVVLLVSWVFGINPAVLLGGLEMIQGTPSQQQRYEPQPQPQRTGAQPKDRTGDFASKILAQTEDVWNELFQKAGQRYPAPRMVLYTRATRSACGLGQSAMGPFYCPNDKTVYLDLSFFNDLARRFGAPGEFAAAYVVAHEIGHHVQNLMGVLPKVNEMKQRVSQREANALSVRVELQADCLAGVWAANADAKYKVLEPGDVDQALRAATAIGDDRLQREAQGHVVPDAFTHGSSQQRVTWFTRGLKGGTVKSCDTFQATQL